MFFFLNNFLACFGLISFLLSVDVYARGLYLNGKDISGARDENLESVRVKIDSKGDIWISGERYRVATQEHYVPVEKKSDVRAHLPKEVKGVNATQKLSDDKDLSGDKIASEEPHDAVPSHLVNGDRSSDKLPQKAQVAMPTSRESIESSEAIKQKPADILVKEGISSKE